ncbi:MAG: VWA domain-containing protein [Candidatus Thorarchaeota archaeon]|jgi:Mg-chelatase subunit ChlD
MQNDSDMYSVKARFSNTLYGDDNKMFGVLNLDIKDDKDRPANSQHFILSVDRSGSMATRERDGMTKMDHVIHTISNMMRYFAYELKTAKIFVSVIAFDNKIERIIDKERVSKSNIKELVSIVEDIYPRDMTDIGAALTAANMQKNGFPENIEQTHILLTDGRPTYGATDMTDLKHMVDPTYRNILIGYGIDHNMRLMKELSDYDDGSYYFVESAENAGNVYGEILHNVLNEVMSNVVIGLDDAEIYDWKKNEWSKALRVGSLSHGIEKVYHVRREPDQDDMENVLCVSLQYAEGMTDKRDLVPVTMEKFASHFDATKYIYRQKTLEFLFETERYIESSGGGTDVDKLREDIASLMKLISHDMEAEDALKDPTCRDYLFMQNLRDDLHVAEKSILSRHGGLYLGARILSQGDQRAYNVKNLDAMDSAFPGWDDTDGPLPPLGAIDRTCPAGKYQMSSADASPYACTNQRYLMRQCSQDPTCPSGDD